MCNQVAARLGALLAPKLAIAGKNDSCPIFLSSFLTNICSDVKEPGLISILYYSLTKLVFGLLLGSDSRLRTRIN